MLSVLSHVNRMYGSMTYRIGSSLVDPGDLWMFEGISNVLLTHAHFDHIYGLNDVARLSPGLKVYTNVAGRDMLLDSRKNLSFYHDTPFIFNYPERIVVVDDGNQIDIGEGAFATAVFTPGHNPSCISWLLDESIFTGDSYIPGLKTVSNLPQGNRTEARVSEHKILSLAHNRQIYAGHQT